MSCVPERFFGGRLGTGRTPRMRVAVSSARLCAAMLWLVISVTVRVSSAGAVTNSQRCPAGDGCPEGGGLSVDVLGASDVT